MRSTTGFDLPAPSGFGAHQLRRAMELSAEAVSGRSRQPTYEELWGESWRQPRHEPFRDAEHGLLWFSPVLAALFAIVLGSMSLVGLKGADRPRRAGERRALRRAGDAGEM